MKLATSLATVFVLCICTAAFASVNSTPDAALDVDQAIALKDANVDGIPNPQPNVGGDTIGSAVAIPALPYNDGGNTCSFNNDYDEVCPYTGSLSPDVVYSYSPAADECDRHRAVHVALRHEGLRVRERRGQPGRLQRRRVR